MKPKIKNNGLFSGYFLFKEVEKMAFFLIYNIIKRITKKNDMPT